MQFEHIGFYRALVEETQNKEESREAIMSYVKNKSIGDIFIQDMDKIKYTPENIQSYMDAYLSLNINGIDNFIEHIANDYIIKQKILLQEICHYEPIQEYIRTYLSEYIPRYTDDETIIYINKHITIKTLNVPLFNAEITDLGISSLTEITSLNILNSKLVTDKSVSNLNLTRLSASYTNITDYTYYRLVNLTYLDVGGESFISDECLSTLVNLTYLDISCNKQLSDKALINLTNLRILSIYDTHITDLGISSLTNLERLITNKLITNIQCLPNLRILDAGFNIHITQFENLSYVMNTGSLHHTFPDTCKYISFSTMTLNNIMKIEITKN
jgi:hypothetical protein